MEVRRADPPFQRLVLLVLVAGTCAGALLVGAIDRYREALADWVRADAARLAQRIELVFAVFAVALVAPLRRVSAAGIPRDSRHASRARTRSAFEGAHASGRCGIAHRGGDADRLAFVEARVAVRRWHQVTGCD
jgi:hypothetical protein